MVPNHRKGNGILRNICGEWDPQSPHIHQLDNIAAEASSEILTDNVLNLWAGWLSPW